MGIGYRMVHKAPAVVIPAEDAKREAIMARIRKVGVAPDDLRNLRFHR